MHVRQHMIAGTAPFPESCELEVHVQILSQMSKEPSVLQYACR